MEYTIITGNLGYDILKFIETVNKYIKQGWTPLGGVATSSNTIMQAMVRNSSKP